MDWVVLNVDHTVAAGKGGGGGWGGGVVFDNVG